MRSLNRIELIGNLGRDAETRFTIANVSVTSVTLATTNSYKGKDGNWVNDTTWHNVIGFNLSDSVKESLKKGIPVYLSGRLSKRDYTDNDGNKKLAVEVVADTIFALTANAKSSDAPGAQEPAYAGNNGGGGLDQNDDLPF